MKLNSWIIFIRERFDPISHFLMITVFLAVHILLVYSLGKDHLSTTNIVALLIAVTLFYFKLRLYDEVKDYELDVIINKDRPLPRGILNHIDMFWGMRLCIFFELLLFSLRGPSAFFSMLLAISYSLLMYKEFFMREKIRPLLTTYALMHTIVTTLLSIAIFSFLLQENFIAIVSRRELIYFAFANWFLFNIFEFGRKTFSSSEERENIESYSSIFGRAGAVFLVISQAIAAHFLVYLIGIANLKLLTISQGILFLILVLISTFYIMNNSYSSAKGFRAMSSIYIIMFYLTMGCALIF